MKNKNVIFAILIVGLIALNIYLNRLNQSISKNLSSTSDYLRTAELLIKTERDITNNVISILKLTIGSEGRQIDKQQLVTDITGKTIPMRDIIGTLGRKVYFIPEYSCDVCYDSLISKLIIVSKTNQDIIALCPINKTRDVSSFFGDKSINIKVYGLSSKIDIPAYEGFAPFFFLIDKDLKIQNIHIPIKDRFNLTDLYLQETFK